MKRLRAASSKIRETESELTFYNRYRKVQIQKFIREISYLDGFFTFKVMYEESEEYFKGGKYLDFSLELISNPGCFCDEHEAEFWS